MKTHPRRFITIIAAGLGLATTLAAAADQSGKVQRIEKTIVVDSTGKPEVRRELATFLGVEVADAPPVLSAQLRLPEGQGLVVRFVEPDSPAAKAGLQRHDVLLRLDDQILIDPRQLAVLVRGKKDGQQVTLVHMRAGTEARATATLVRREVPADRLRWFRRDLEFPFGERGELVPLPEDFAERLQERVDRSVRHIRIPPPPPSHGVPGGPRVMIFRPGTRIVLSDNAGTLELLAGEEEQTLRATDAAGGVIFEGPVGTPEERAKLPPDLLERLGRLESMEVVPPPAPPVPPALPAPPAPAGPGAGIMLLDSTPVVAPGSIDEVTSTDPASVRLFAPRPYDRLGPERWTRHPPTLLGA